MNRLSTENSPYLLQHAHNPVHWYPWGDEALQKAKSENKVILISIGYAACHWCHVMEKESFENEATAKLMNDNFINIKVDREERPDIDAIYMDAVQTITGSGGWPLNVFLTPDTKPFYGGTYFPPVKAYNRSSWADVLIGVSQAWKERSNEIIAQAENLTEHINKSNFLSNLKTDSTNDLFTKENCAIICENLLKNADTVWGGFGNAPKFPQTFTIQYLLQYYHFTQHQPALSQALLSIDKMLYGGIYDQIGGGLARYSTDEQWLAPHFEKMLYDNALFINILVDAYQLTKDDKYKKTIEQTIIFLQREMLDKDGGFYAAIDADSEGVEGKFYVWTKTEIETILGNDAETFCKFYDVTDEGNWEETNILRILNPIENFAKENNIEVEVLAKKLQQNCVQLFNHRSKRIRPITDDKILLNWNALTITALCKAAAALNNSEYAQLAETTFNFLLNNFKEKNSTTQFYHTYKNGVAKYPAFLDDYACLIQASIHLQEITSNTTYLTIAKELTTHVINNFVDEETSFFYFTNATQKDVIIRKKEVYDGATPSGNSIMAQNLFYLAKVFDEQIWHNHAQKINISLQNAILKYPSSFGVWASSILTQTYGIYEVAIVGKNFEEMKEELLQNYFPNKILQASRASNPLFPILSGKIENEKTIIFLCKNYTCAAPLTTVNKAILSVNNYK